MRISVRTNYSNITNNNWNNAYNKQLIKHEHQWRRPTHCPCTSTDARTYMHWDCTRIFVPQLDDDTAHLMAQVVSAFHSPSMVIWAHSPWLDFSHSTSTSSSCLSTSSSSTSSCSLSSSTRWSWKTFAFPRPKRVRTPWTPSPLPQFLMSMRCARLWMTASRTIAATRVFAAIWAILLVWRCRGTESSWQGHKIWEHNDCQSSSPCNIVGSCEDALGVLGNSGFETVVHRSKRKLERKWWSTSRQRLRDWCTSTCRRVHHANTCHIMCDHSTCCTLRQHLCWSVSRQHQLWHTLEPAPAVSAKPAPVVENISPASAVSYVTPVQPCTLRMHQLWAHCANICCDRGISTRGQAHRACACHVVRGVSTCRVCASACGGVQRASTYRVRCAGASHGAHHASACRNRDTSIRSQVIATLPGHTWNQRRPCTQRQCQ